MLRSFYRRADSYFNAHPRMMTLCVTGFFLAIAVISHINFIIWPATMFGLGGSDELSQMAPAVSFLEHAADSGDLYWSWSYGLGGEPYSGFIYYYTASPVFWLSYIIKRIAGATGGGIYSVQRWKTAFSILKQACTMLSVYALLRYEGKRRPLACISGAVYGLSAWFFMYSLRFDYMPDIMLYLPLGVLAWRYYIKEKRMLPLCAAIAVIIANNLLTGYMCCILLASMFLVFSGEQGGDIRSRLRYIASLVPPVVIGLLLSAVAFIPAVAAFTGIDRTGTAALSLIPDRAMMLDVLSSFFSADGLISLPPFIWLAAAVNWRGASPLCRRKSVLAAIWLAACFIPPAYSVMSGFSYANDRWYFAPIFVCAYALPDWLDELSGLKDRLQGAKKAVIPAACFVLAAAFAVLSAKTASLRHGIRCSREIIFAYIALGVLSVLAAGVMLYVRHAGARRAAAWATAVCLALSGAAHCIYLSAANGQFSSYDSAELRYYLTGSKEHEDISAALVPDSGSFFRVSDEEAFISDSRYENRSWIERTYTDSAYNSLIDGDLHSYIKNDLLVLQRYVQPSFYRGFNSRLFLETAWGIEYKLNADIKHAGAGWEQVTPDCGGTVLHNRFSTGLDMWYTSVIDSEEYDSLSVAQKDATLLQAVRSDDLCGVYPTAQTDDVTLSYDVDLTHAQMTGCELCGDVLSVRRDAQITLPLPQQSSSGEYLLCMTVRSLADTDFTLTVNGIKSTRFADSYEWSYAFNDFAVRLPADAHELVIKLTPGEYSVSDMSLSYNSYDCLASWVESREQYSLENLNINGGRVTGTLNNCEDGILVLAIPYSSGWHCTVDGKRQDTVRANGMFTAIELKAGSNEIELKYIPQTLVTGAAISAFTALCLAVYICLSKKRNADIN